MIVVSLMVNSIAQMPLVVFVVVKLLKCIVADTALGIFWSSADDTRKLSILLDFLFSSSVSPFQRN